MERLPVSTVSRRDMCSYLFAYVSTSLYFMYTVNIDIAGRVSVKDQRERSEQKEHIDVTFKPYPTSFPTRKVTSCVCDRMML